MPAGRPRVEIDWTVFERLCSLQCTLVEIARVFGCSEDTIERAVKRHYKVKGHPAPHFAEVYKRYAADGLVSLRRAQFKSAIGTDKSSGNVVMQIWLGKQYLGQSDKMELKDPSADGRSELDKLSDDELLAACRAPEKKRRG